MIQQQHEMNRDERLRAVMELRALVKLALVISGAHHGGEIVPDKADEGWQSWAAMAQAKLKELRLL